MTKVRGATGALEAPPIVVGRNPRTAVVMLHGYAMGAADLSPFAVSLGLEAVFYVPEGPLQAIPTGRAWWPMDRERRQQSLLNGPRDLAEERPAGAPPARALLGDLLARVRRAHPDLPLVVIAFSQGGMLACDAVLHDDARPDGLALLSSSRIDVANWRKRADRLRGLPVLVSHGELDDDLAFAAGEALRDFCTEAGATVTWIAFPGGHSIPLVVWRAIRRFVAGISRREAPNDP